MADTGFGRALEHLRSVADGDGHTEGKLFERLIMSFLKADRLYADRFTEVWLWNDYPGRNGRPDFGIDLVARESDGSLCAIQCKFYADKRLVKSDIDSFLEAGSRSEFQHMMLVYSGKGYGKKVEDALSGHKCQALNFESLASSSIDWPDLAAGLTKVNRIDPYELMEHQKQALNDVATGLGKAERGQMLMACGTGKTLTSLRIAESLAEGKSGFLVLYAVPSISLMHQVIRYWSEQRTISHSYIGVCSDPKVSHGEKTEIPIVEMEIGVSTDERRIASALKRDMGRMTVVFATYQSMESVMEAQKMAKVPFDLVISDEAHRTTGIEGRSSFTLVHSDENIVARKRLYMTATPKIYRAASRTIASNADNTLYSMDRQSVYGRVLYRLDFSDAIDLKLLSDYKVIVLGVDERYGGMALQNLVNTTTEAGDLNLTDAARMLGYYRVLENPDPDSGMRSLQTSIAYTNRIRDSETFANTFKKLALEADLGGSFSCDARHVDGTQNASIRADALQWLRDSPANPDECLILSNAKCLSEGIDVPALDSICFLNPKSSPGEIVQAVGRVMRKAPGKEYGYVIIPIGVPPDARSETILDNNRVFDQVWDILRAMRSHDARLDIEANVADLKKELPKRVKIIGVDREGRMRPQEGSDAFPLGELDVPADVLYSRIVEEVGDRRYFVRWAGDVAEVVARLQERVLVVLQDGRAKAKFDTYMTAMREIIHDEFADSEGIEMLAQHLVTRRIFNAMFDSDDFARQNPVSVALDGVVDELRSYGLDTELRDIEGFYKSIEHRVSNLDTHAARQPVISELYGSFFKKAFPETAKRLGIVYTPTELVDFTLRSVDYVLQENFGRSLTDKGVNVIDPFTGAGTFMARLMSEDLSLIQEKDLERKYKNELFASELILLAYYIAAVNCEAIYGQRIGKFERFEGLSLMNTFNLGSLNEHTGDIMAGPKHRILRQRKADITAVIGNPPWSLTTKSEYPEVRKKVASTYGKQASTGNKKTLYNCYILAFRHASDMIKNGGVIGFITPSSYLTAPVMKGVRACLRQEFTDIWCFDLQGDANLKREERRKTGGTVFGAGSREPVTIVILVKNSKQRNCIVRYKKIDDYLNSDKKLEQIKTFKSIDGIKDWYIIKEHLQHDWLDQRGSEDNEFKTHTPLGSKNEEAGRVNTTNTLFYTHSFGVKSHRDSWVYNASIKDLERNMKNTIKYCASQDLDNFKKDDSKAAWSKCLSKRLKKWPKSLKFNKSKIRMSQYRPFIKHFLYFDLAFIEVPYQIPEFFPMTNSKNLTIMVPNEGSGKFSVFITKSIPDVHVVNDNRCFPLKDGKKENITNWALKRYRSIYKNDSIAKKDVFYYIYGILHHKEYRQRYNKSLETSLPHVPFAPDFWAFSKAGKELAGLHLGYEKCPRYDLGRPFNPIPDYPQSIRFATGGDQSTLYVGGIKVYDNLPEIKYEVGGMTPVGWLTARPKKPTSGIDRYYFRVFTGRQLQAMIERLVHVGIESERIIDDLPEEFMMDVPQEPTGLDVY